MAGKSTLCWDCKHATTNACSWARDFVPVDGWKVVERRVMANNRTRKGQKVERYVKSYIVLDCPQFRRDAKDFGWRRL